MRSSCGPTGHDPSVDVVVGQLAEARSGNRQRACLRDLRARKRPPPEGRGRNPDDLFFGSGCCTLEPAFGQIPRAMVRNPR
jgi:hypothetical protein